MLLKTPVCQHVNSNTPPPAKHFLGPRLAVPENVGWIHADHGPVAVAAPRRADAAVWSPSLDKAPRFVAGHGAKGGGVASSALEMLGSGHLVCGVLVDRGQSG